MSCSLESIKKIVANIGHYRALKDRYPYLQRISSHQSFLFLKGRRDDWTALRIVVNRWDTADA